MVCCTGDGRAPRSNANGIRNPQNHLLCICKLLSDVEYVSAKSKVNPKLYAWSRVKAGQMFDRGQRSEYRIYWSATLCISHIAGISTIIILLATFHFIHVCLIYYHKICQFCMYVSRFTIVSREAKKKQAIRDKRVSYLHIASL